MAPPYRVVAIQERGSARLRTHRDGHTTPARSQRAFYHPSDRFLYHHLVRCYSVSPQVLRYWQRQPIRGSIVACRQTRGFFIGGSSSKMVVVGNRLDVGSWRHRGCRSYRDLDRCLGRNSDSLNTKPQSCRLAHCQPSTLSSNLLLTSVLEHQESSRVSARSIELPLIGSFRTIMPHMQGRPIPPCHLRSWTDS
jgi:hypothetical protein